MIVRVRKAGLLTTIQDLGRWGYQSQGVPVAGPMDVYSHRVANALVGNADDAATLEVTLVGPELEFTDERDVAVVGAEFERVPTSVTRMRAGDRLAFGPRIRGARAYVAIAGGIDTPAVLGSRATHVASGMGGVDGRAVRAGDELPLGHPTAGVLAPRAVPPIWVQGVATLRVLPGPHSEGFATGALAALASTPYRIESDSNRQGYRLSGPKIAHARGADIISDATPMGTVQVPASGQPILLMADRQTTGGYAKIATVISADLPVAGQLAPGEMLRFAVCSADEARVALAELEQRLTAVTRRSA